MMSLRSLWRAGSEAVPQRPSLVPVDTDPLNACVQLERWGAVAGDPELWRGHPNFDHVYNEALAAIDNAFALVPEGFVALASTINDAPGTKEVDVDTDPFLMARVCVTNEQFQKFVDAGGYGDLELWPEEIWPHLIGFKDQTDQPAPRYWRKARFQAGLASHPVVGLSWYEASAYSQWVGFRLPTEAEWQMAASWRIRSSAHGLRAYPWGHSYDRKRCNVWNSEVHHTVDVNAYSEGAAPNGVLQLIGNVWEWTSSDLEITDESGRLIVGDMLMKGVRGGAFDTYFAAQATSQFRSGLPCLARAANTGFRLAMDVATVG
ncbi:MAG: iron(II)-dependent oxidoreductase [Hyphomicrobiaceae bacterium]|jgi:iron(II)-dependent oxidoreductase